MTSQQTCTVAVVTGGHSYDVPNFHRLIRSLDGIDPYVQSIDDFASSPKAVRQAYDAVVFYVMMMDGPVDEDLPWYAGKPLSALSELGETTQGIVVLHHAILAYPRWGMWNDLVGIADRKFGFYMNETVSSHIASAAHPITSGQADWTMMDETYTMADAGAGSDVLLTYDHPRSMHTIAWTRGYRSARVFCYQAGHDNLTWADPHFRGTLRRGILWSACKL
jgi:hypothetical protein